MQLPSLPSLCFVHTGFDNSSCKCQPDHYCLSSISESLIIVLSPTVILYTCISVPVSHFSLLVCAFCFCPLTVVVGEQM